MKNSILALGLIGILCNRVDTARLTLEDGLRIIRDQAAHQQLLPRSHDHDYMLWTQVSVLSCWTSAEQGTAKGRG